jgi:Fe-S-cluster containining protein
MSEWTRHGECNDCGHCCTMVARDAIVRTDAQVARDPAFYAARGFKPTRVDGDVRFVLFAWLRAPCPQLTTVGEARDERVAGGVFGDAGMTYVPALDARSHCRIYETRPETCATFPRLPVDIVGTPCSYWFERDGQRIGGTGSPHPGDEHALLKLEG